MGYNATKINTVGDLFDALRGQPHDRLVRASCQGEEEILSPFTIVATDKPGDQPLTLVLDEPTYDADAQADEDLHLTAEEQIELDKFTNE